MWFAVSPSVGNECHQVSFKHKRNGRRPSKIASRKGRIDRGYEVLATVVIVVGVRVTDVLLEYEATMPGRGCTLSNPEKKR